MGSFSFMVWCGMLCIRCMLKCRLSWCIWVVSGVKLWLLVVFGKWLGVGWGWLFVFSSSGVKGWY